MKHALTALALLAALPGLAAAETDGTLGASSTGSLNLSLEVQEQKRIQITGFEDVTQTIERGVQQEDAPNFDAYYSFSDSGEKPALCVRTDEAGLYTLDWSLTPLSDGQNIENLEVQIFSGAPSSGNFAVMRDLKPILSAESGSTPNLQSIGIGGECTKNNADGKIVVDFNLRGNGRTYDTVGTYEATVTLTVKPQ